MLTQCQKVLEDALDQNKDMTYKSRNSGVWETEMPQTTGHSQRSPNNMSRMTWMDSSKGDSSRGRKKKGISDQLKHLEVVLKSM